MGRNNTQLRPLTHKHDDPDGLSVRGPGSQAVPGGPMRCMHGTERQKSGPIHELSGLSSEGKVVVKTEAA
jgi:hypothetical protein